MDNQRRISPLIVVAAIFAWALARPTYAAEISLFDHPICKIRLAGEIIPGDGKKLKEILELSGGASYITLCLDSPGGSFAEALNVGELIAALHVSTFVDKNASCLSACAIAFMYASSRTMHIQSKLGFHAPFLVLDTSANSEKGYSSATVEAAYEAALSQIRRLLFLSDVSGLEPNKFSGIEASRFSGATSRSLFSTRLVTEILGYGRKDMFFIDTLEKAIFSGIVPYGIENPLEIGKSAYINLCEHAYIDMFGRRGARSYLDEPEPYVNMSRTKTDDYSTETKGVAFDAFEGASTSCIASVIDVRARALELHHRLRGRSTSQESTPSIEISINFVTTDVNRVIEHGATDESDNIVPIWYVYNPVTPLLCLAGEADAHCRRVRSAAMPNKTYCSAGKFNTLDIKADEMQKREQACPKFFESHKTLVDILPKLEQNITTDPTPNNPVIVWRNTAIKRYVSVAFRYAGQESRTVQNYNECEKGCAEASTCAAFTYFKDRRLCRLMETQTEQIPDLNANSGIKLDASAQ